MRNRRRVRRRQIAEINVVPYIDVMLVLLIIFMVTTPLLTQGVKVDLPQAAAKKMAPEENQPIVVTVDAQGAFFANIATNPKQAMAGESVALLVKNALSRDPQRKVYVRGDRHANYGQVMQAMVVLQKAGANSVGLLTEDNTG